MNNFIPVSTLFMGLNGAIAFALSYIVVMERMSIRVWHGESKVDVSNQPNYLDKPSQWVVFVENFTQKAIVAKVGDDGILQRKVRAYGNFMEYVPMALMFILALELMNSQTWLLWVLGIALTIGRIAHAYGIIKTYGPSPGRAVGFFLTWFVYLLGASACVYYGVSGILQ
jgi:uncharacterized protein